MAVSGLAEYRLLVGGREVEPEGGAFMESVNPATGEPWARIAEAEAADVDRAVRAADAAWRSEAWRGLSPTRRGRLLMRLADLVAANAERIAQVETTENGKLLKEMRAQLAIVPDYLVYFGGLADKVEGRVIPLDRQSVLNYTLREPYGVVGAITPWNSPVLLTTMAIAPALAAGNAVVVKPSEAASAGVIEFARLAEEAGFPTGIVNVVTGGKPAGEALVDHPGVAKITFTGGPEGGRRIAERAGARLVSCTLELGGKSPNMVFADADLDAATAGVLAGIYGAGGQTCVAGSRLLVEERIRDELVGRLVQRAGSIRLGDPTRAETQMGPMATAQQLARVESFVASARADGASVLTGGGRATVADLPSGFFFEPTILADAPLDSRVVREEVFGPVLAVIPFTSDDEAVRIANDTRYGLAAGVWTRDVKRAHRLARRLEAGTVWVNTYRAITFNSPFGGFKDSGLGRVNGMEAMSEFLQTKSVWIELGDEIQDPFTIR